MGLVAFTVSTDALRGVEFSDMSSIKTPEDFRLARASWIFFSSFSTLDSNVAT